MASLGKKSLHPNEQRREAIAKKRLEWLERLKTIDWGRLVFLDETGAKTNMTRIYARSRRGDLSVGYAHHGHWNTTTLVASITPTAAIAPMILDGPMDSAAFEAK